MRCTARRSSQPPAGLVLLEQPQRGGLNRSDKDVERVSPAGMNIRSAASPGRPLWGRALDRPDGRSPSTSRRLRSSSAARPRPATPLRSRTPCPAPDRRAAVKGPLRAPTAPATADTIRTGRHDDPRGEGRSVEAVIDHRVEVRLQAAHALGIRNGRRSTCTGKFAAWPRSRRGATGSCLWRRRAYDGNDGRNARDDSLCLVRHERED